MKTFLTVSSKVLILGTVLFVLASNAVFAGEKHIPEATEDATYNTYSNALRELEMFFSRAENFQDFFELEERVVIYDTNFELVRSAIINPDNISEDKELLMTLRSSSKFMSLENTTYYIMNN